MSPTQIVEAAVAATGVSGATPLTQGGQKWVLAADLAGAPVVLKIVPVPPGPAAAVAVERAHREVELLAAVDSIHVVSVLSEAIEIEDPPTAVVWLEERLDGADLTPGLGNRVWSDQEVFRLMRDIGEGLAECHKLAVVHRDLSPGNVRQLSSGSFVIMDPGFARHLTKTAITGIHQPGTPGFRSPEHVPGGAPTPASDVFGLGILAFLARTGRFPVDPSGQPREYDDRLRSEQAPSILSLDATVDPQLAAAIDRSLLRQPARRFLNGSELVAYLDTTDLGRN